MKYLSVLSVLALAGAMHAVAQAQGPAQDQGVLIRAVSLLQEPYSDAAQAAELPAQTAVAVLARQGAWMQVRAGEQTGWVRLLAVRMNLSAARGDSGVGKAVNLALSGSSGAAVATGVRGLDQAQIANATPDLAAADRLSAYAVSAEQAQAFAAEAPALHAQPLDYLKR